MVWLYGVLLTLAWGVGAFGSPYPWAYTPLLLSSSCLGIIGLWVGRRQTGLSPVLMVGFTLISLSILAQLVPLPLSRIGDLSPHANAIVDQRDLLPQVGATGPRPLSIDPSRTRLGLAFFGAFAVLLIGTARALTRERAEFLASSLVILGAALATIGIVQRATWNGKIYGFWELVQGGTPYGPFINKNHFAGWMLMGTLVGFGYFTGLLTHAVRGARSWRQRVMWFSTPEEIGRAHV